MSTHTQFLKLLSAVQEIRSYFWMRLRAKSNIVGLKTLIGTLLAAKVLFIRLVSYLGKICLQFKFVKVDWCQTGHKLCP